MTHAFAYDLTDLDVSRKAVRRECGGVGEELAASFGDAVDALLEDARAHTHPQAGYVLTTERFETSEIVAAQLEGAERFAVFLATLGPDFDAWARGFFDTGDPFQGLIANAIGSVAVEAAVDRLEAAVHAEARPGEGVTRRVSPGYCGWDVRHQHRLFALLPDGFLGVRLTEAALMVPLKSVSGLIGFGPGAEWHEYPCALCEKLDCPTRGRTHA